MPRLISLSVLLMFAMMARAAQGVPVERICPIDGKKFRYEAPDAPPVREVGLDMKPIDATAPWPHPKCPGNGFVLYKRDFSEAELARLRDYVTTKEYQDLSEKHSTRYLEAALRRHLGESPYSVAWSLVQASWEAGADPARYKEYAAEALKTYDSIQLQSLNDIRHRILKRMMSGELARRLGDFESARDQFLEMRDSAELSKPFYQRIIELQLRLVRARDARSHPAPR